jgi:hypothetical protein
MKVRLYSLAAIAAIALASQGVAQENDQSLERALAELNSGLAAPDHHGTVKIDGDFRARNRWFDDGMDTNNRDLDTRARLNFWFNVTDTSRAFVGFSGREAFGGSVAGRHDLGDSPFEAGGEGLDRAYVEVDSLVNDGGTVTIGRKYYTLGSGRLLGSENWDNLVTTFSGIWYGHPLMGFNLHAAMLNGVENGLSDSDDMIYILGADWACDRIEFCGPIHLAPWIMRDETASGGSTGTHETWFGVDVNGGCMGVDYDFDFTRYEFGDFEGTAWYAGAGFELEQLESVPGIQGGGINVAISDSDDEFAVPGVNSVGAPYGLNYHDSVGFADVLGTSGIWTTDTDTWKVGVGISPAEGWQGGVSLMNIETAGVEFDEIDISLGTHLGGNVSTWFGYAWIDPDAGADDMAVFWATFDLAFGG